MVSWGIDEKTIIRYNVIMNEETLPYEQQSLVFRLRKRAEIRRQIQTRKSVQNGEPDRLADLLEEAAEEIERLKEIEWMYKDLE